MRKALAPLAAALLLGCTSVSVTPLPADLGSRSVCIEKNERVEVPGFLEIIRDGFDRHRIPTRVFDEAAPSTCEITLTYTARRSWDLATYLSEAELWLRDGDGRLVAHAEYHLRAKGGFSLTKWASAESKMEPVLDELLAEYAARR